MNPMSSIDPRCVTCERHDVRSARKDRADSKNATTISELRPRKTMKQQPKTIAKQSTIWPNTNFQASSPLAPAPKVPTTKEKREAIPLSNTNAKSPLIVPGKTRILTSPVVAIGRTLFAKWRMEAMSKTRIALQRRKSPSKT